MRKIILAMFIAGTMAFSFSSCGGGNDISTARVPSDVLDEFYDMYPAARNADWEMKNGLYEVDFELGGEGMKATYTPDGDFVKVSS